MATDTAVRFAIEPVTAEFEGAELGDPRRTKRLVRLAGQLADVPGRSFPKSLVNTGDLEAGYRFFSNEHVSAEAISAPHRERAWARGSQSDWLLSLEDTTEMRFTGGTQRAGLGRLMNDGQGFYLHTSLLVALDAGADRPIPLGVVAYEILVRGERGPKRPWREEYANPNKESLRWMRLMTRVDEAADAHLASVIHVADREACKYELLAERAEQQRRFIIRVRGPFLDRAARGPTRSASFVREVDLSPRVTDSSGGRSARKVRAGRRATLTFQSCPVTLKRPKHVSKERAPEMQLNVVEVREQNAPTGIEPVSWVLVTTESIASDDDVLRVVDAYRARWMIEEYFKALKTGCAFETRQLDSLGSLETALAVFIPIAWQMLLLRGVVRDAPATPPEQVLGPRLLILLVALAAPSLNIWGMKLSKKPTAREVLYAVARMGGHLPNNGPPGWLTIRRGLDDLYALDQAAQMLGFPRCDQS